MRIALAQMNSCLGDFQGNVKKILHFANEAVEKRCDLVVFPELNILGYHPCDLLERATVIEKQQQAIDQLVSDLPKDLACLIGAVTKNSGKGKPYFNSALLIHQGKVQKAFNKELLPVYDVFDDSRFFTAGRMSENTFSLNEKNIQVLICEDMWGWDSLHESNPVEHLDPEKTDLIINMSASPVTLSKRELRLQHARSTSKQLQAPLVYVNMVGAQDELVYDGGSFAIDSKGELVAQSAYFVEDLNVVDFDQQQGGFRDFSTSDTEYLRQSLVLGLRDFINKNGIEKVHLGLSGGIDSAVVACLAADAVGPQRLTAIALPSKFNSLESLELAEKLSANIHCHFHQISIQKSFETMIESYENSFGKKEFSLLHENLQARIRGCFLMAFSNEHQSLLITTGNKTEYAAGYSTLYGDTCGGIAPIGDLLKSQVYDLAEHYNAEHELIPRRIIDREPSAELSFDQKDSDSLPDYDLLDASVDKIVNRKEEAKSETDQWLLQQLYRSEFKRWQVPPILKVSDHAFGQGRRMPIAHRARF